MKQIITLKKQIADVSCERELGWLQLRLLVLNLMNTLVALSHNNRETIIHIKQFQSLYTQYLQMPFSSIQDAVLCTSVKNEVMRQLNDIEEAVLAQAA